MSNIRFHASSLPKIDHHRRWTGRNFASSTNMVFLETTLQPKASRYTQQHIYNTAQDPILLSLKLKPGGQDRIGPGTRQDRILGMGAWMATLR